MNLNRSSVDKSNIYQYTNNICQLQCNIYQSILPIFTNTYIYGYMHVCMGSERQLKNFTSIEIHFILFELHAM